MITRFKTTGAIVLAAALAACATQPAPHMAGSAPVNGGGGYNNNNAGYNNGGGNYANASYGTVTRIDTLDKARDSGVGALIGAGVGAVVGNQIGRQMNDAKTTGTVVGAAGGGLLGNAIERNQNKNNTVNRIYVRLDNGAERYWELPVSALNVQVGSRVRVENDQLYAN
jgi:outer membrane lipoprotein SlyB